MHAEELNTDSLPAGDSGQAPEPRRRTGVTMRATLSASVVLMGLLGLTLALLTGEAYRQLAIENQRAALLDLVELETASVLEDLATDSRDLGLFIQKEPAFRGAFASRDKEKLLEILNSQFFQYYVTAGVINLKKLYVYDAAFDLVVESTDGETNIPAGVSVCPQMLERAAARTGAARVKIISDICSYDGHPYYSVLVTVGGLRPLGYLQLVSAPSYNLAIVESALGMPVHIKDPAGDTTFQSASWPEQRDARAALEARYTLRGSNGQPALELAVAKDLTDLNRSLSKTRYIVMVAASVITLAATFLMLLVLERTTLAPMRRLTEQLRRVRRDKAHLGEVVKTRGNSEVRQLAHDFNEMTTELKSLYEALEQMAFTDPLTALPNRSRLHEILQYHTQVHQRTGLPFALLMMDLDRFKEVNDTLGHHAGDMLLQQVGSRLENVLRKTDIVTRLESSDLQRLELAPVARLGGDEFAAVLPKVNSRDDAATVANKILHELDTPFVVGGHTFNIGVSIGIALCPEHAVDGYSLMRLADVAMYQAKLTQAGFCFYDSAQDSHSVHQLTLESELRAAIEETQLVLHYQPKIDMGRAQVCGVEALVRWEHPQRGTVGPDQFVPLAERSGLIHLLTATVLHQALRQCARWHEQGLDLPVSVNISAKCLFDPELPQIIADGLKSLNVPPERLVLELTESAVMTDPARAQQILTDLDAMGIRLSIDDFGTGYSSLLYLKRLPVDEIKIDKSFVLDMLNDRNDAAIVRSTIDLAHNMGLQVVAEGVENLQTWTELVKWGCEVAQGYYMGRPMSAEALDRWLQTSEWGLAQARSSK